MSGDGSSTNILYHSYHSLAGRVYLDIIHTFFYKTLLEKIFQNMIIGLENWKVIYYLDIIYKTLLEILKYDNNFVKLKKLELSIV